MEDRTENRAPGHNTFSSEEPITDIVILRRATRDGLFKPPEINLAADHGGDEQSGSGRGNFYKNISIKLRHFPTTSVLPRVNFQG